MESFFSRIKSYFSGDYGGRYLELILKEVGVFDGGVGAALFPKGLKDGIRFNKAKHRFEVECRFVVPNTKGAERIADIAVVEVDSDEIIGLVEIKYEDHKQPTNAAQLMDYIAYSSKHGVPFVYLTQYYPPSSDLDALRESQSRHFLYSDIAQELDQKNHLSRLLIEYFKENGLMYEQIDIELLGKLLIRFFNPQRGHGKIRNIEHMTNLIPETFRQVLQNMRLLSSEIRHCFVGIDEKSRQPSIDFCLQPKYNKKKIAALVKDSESFDDIEPDSPARSGGRLCVYAMQSLYSGQDRDNNWLYVEYGFLFNMDVGLSEPSIDCYAKVLGKNIKDEIYDDKRCKANVLMDKGKAVSDLRHVIGSVFERAKKYAVIKSYIPSLE
ncbi:MAG TPA: hypothetical protein VI457_02110 [Methylococcaceae bacterium]|nr:hypothetical protein [Methylococcaceae bacterium]